MGSAVSTTAPRILITGSPHRADLETVLSGLLRAWYYVGKPDPPVIVVGRCPTGAEYIAEGLARLWGWPVEPHPVTDADWRRIGPGAGPRRNQRMVDAGADVCVAFLTDDARGTRDCVQRAKAAGIPVIPITRSVRERSAA
jgi:hypothetical protein